MIMRNRWGKVLRTDIPTQLLLLDDFGLAPLSDPERRDLLEVLDVWAYPDLADR
jgi:DNA replication protein DnaC